MNRFCVSIAIVVACVGVASAGKGAGKNHHVEEDIEFEPHHHQHHGFGGGHLHHLADEVLFEELARRGHHHLAPMIHHPGHLRHGVHGIPHKGIPKGVHKGRHGRIPIGAGGVAGHAGSIHEASGQAGGVGGKSHLGSHNLAEGGRNSVVKGNKHLDAGQHREGHHDDEGIHKHQVVNSDKTIIKDHLSGVNDVDGFRHSGSHSEGEHVSSGASGLASESSQGKLEHDHSADNSFGAFGASGEEFGASGASGAAGAGGALV